jgi:hypothetical protein
MAKKVKKSSSSKAARNEEARKRIVKASRKGAGKTKTLKTKKSSARKPAKKAAKTKVSKPVAKVSADARKIMLGEERIPKGWYNIMADLPVPPPPPLHPGTKQPVGPGDLAPLFPMALIMQEVTQERYVDIPKPVTDIYRLWRPTPLYRATALEKALGTTAKIFYKYEGVSPAGSHKPNTAVPQAFFNKEEGVKKLVTDTGAGQ